jgi:outer membrane receptor protein involved in Fe transport
MALLALAFASPVMAQHAPELRGRVLDAATSSPIQDAEVLLSDGSRTVTGSDGGFLLRTLKPGALQVTVRRVGFAPVTRDLELINGSSSSLTVMLSAAPVQLSDLITTAPELTAGGVTAIDRAAIERSGASDLADILQQQGGVVVTRAGGPGSPATASIRGSSANQVLVLVDGVPQNQAVSGSADLSLVRLDNVEKISVVRGAQSARYGQQALGGAIVVETRRPMGVEAQADVGAGSYGGRLLSGRVGVGRSTAGGVAASLSGAYNDFAGDFPYDIPPERGGGTGVRFNSAARDVSLNGAVGWTGASAEARLRGEYFDVDRGMPGTVVQPSLTGHQTQQRIGVGLDGTTKLGRASSASASVSLQRQDATFADSAPPFSAPYDDHNRADVFLIDAGATHTAGKWELSGGALFQRMGISGTALSAGAPGTTLYGGTRVAARAPILSGDWALDANAALRLDGSSVTDAWYLSPQVGALLRHDWWSAELRWAQAYNPPTLGDLYFQEGVQVRPNPLLAPERVNSEFALFLEARQVGPASLNANVGFNLFAADISGMILWSPDFRYIWSPNNFDVNRRGGELNVHLAPQGSHVALAGGVALASVTYDGPVLSGQVIYRPLWSATASADATFLGFDAGLAYRYAGSRRTAMGTDLNSLPPVHLLDFRVSRTIPVGGMAIRARFAIDNLIGTRTGMLVDFPLPGRLLRFDISLRYGS